MKKVKQFMKVNRLRLAILLLSLSFCSIFVVQKEGFHMDEILAFELANAQFNPWIVPTQPEGRLAKFYKEYIKDDQMTSMIGNIAFIMEDTIENKGNSILANYKADVYDAPVWISKEMFYDYIRVTKEDAFQFLSVYFNIKDDNHPPLHFMAIHLLCSFFQGASLVVIGCGINLICIAGILWILGKIGDLIFKEKITTYATMILFACSIGVVNMSLWIRMYTMLALFLVWLTYLHIKGLKEGSFVRINVKNQKQGRIGNVGVLVLTVVAFWTQYFSLFLILPLAITTVAILWKKKEIKQIWSYVRTMIIAAIIGVVIYPFSVQHILYSGRGQEAFSQWGNGWFDYAKRLQAFTKILGEDLLFHPFVLIGILVAAIILAIKTKNTGSVLIKACFIPTFFYFLLAAKMSPYYVDRYIMGIYPLVIVCAMYVIEKAVAFTKLVHYKRWILGFAIVIVALGIVAEKGNYTYLYKGYEQQLDVAREYSEYPLVCLYDGYGFYENVLEMEQYQQTLLVKREELSSLPKESKEVLEDGYVLLIKYVGDDQGEAAKDLILEELGGSSATLLLESSCFSDAIYFIK